MAKAIIEGFIESNKPLYLRDLRRIVSNRIKVSSQTLSDTYKAMLKSGLLEKKYRNDPTQLSLQFSNRLKDVADYWENYLTAKKAVTRTR